MLPHLLPNLTVSQGETEATPILIQIHRNRILYICINMLRCILFGSTHPHKPGGGGGTLHMKGVGMLVVSLRGLNVAFWSHLGCSGQNAIIFSSEGLV